MRDDWICDREIYEYIDILCRRPGLYIGEPSIVRLDAHLGGYFMALFKHGIAGGAPCRLMDFPFSWFHFYVSCRYGYRETSKGWARILLEDAQGDDRKAFEMFLQEYELYCNLKPTSCCCAELSDQNEQYMEKCGAAWHPSGTPVHRGVARVYDLELNDGFMHMMFLEWKGGRLEAIDSFMFYESDKELRKDTEQKFGVGLAWKEVSAERLKEMLDTRI